MGVSARQGVVFRQQFDDTVQMETRREGSRIIQTYHTRVGSLRRVSEYHPGDESIGISPRICEYPIKTLDDYRVFEAVASSLVFTPDDDAYLRYNAAIGDTGYPMVIIGPSPIHDLMIRWTGYESAYFHIADEPDVVRHAVRVAEDAYRRMWPIVARSPCRLVMHGVNFDSRMIPPPFFREWFKPYLAGFNAAMHDAGKWTVFHGDGDMSLLLELMIETGFDVADCLACAPLTRMPLADAVKAWADRIVIWGGIPSPLLESDSPEASFREHLDMIRQITNPRSFIGGISDQAMPGSLYDRLALIVPLLNADR
jgi:hypothetical protein